ncbi:hypothetical protein SB758_37640, partial [Burkholderia sp. SIMBA_013]
HFRFIFRHLSRSLIGNLACLRFFKFFAHTVPPPLKARRLLSDAAVSFNVITFGQNKKALHGA